MTQYIDDTKPHVTGDIEWIYIHERQPQRGKLLHILTKGRVSIRGPWRDDMGYIAWQEQFRRNKVKEKEAEAWLAANG